MKKSVVILTILLCIVIAVFLTEFFDKEVKDIADFGGVRALPAEDKSTSIIPFADDTYWLGITGQAWSGIVTNYSTSTQATTTGSSYVGGDLTVVGDADFASDTIEEGDIVFSTACAAGNHYYLSGNDLACEADDDTTYTAGDYIALTGTDFDVDVEAVTDTKCVYWEDPTATDDFKSVYYFEKAATITRLWCESDQTVTMTVQEDDGSPADIETTELVCDSTPPSQTTGFEDATIAAGSRIDFAVLSVASTPTWASFCWSYAYND